MFTQCSKCESVFELSAEVLRTAGGQVRCGQCGEIFNALARLAEDDSAFFPAESAFDLESRADAILEGSIPTARPEADSDALARTLDEVTPGTEVAQLRILDENETLTDEELAAAEAAEDLPPDDPAIFEFTLPPGELDRIFVESKGVPFIALPPGLRPPRKASQPTNATPAGNTATRGEAAARTDTPTSSETAARHASTTPAPPLLTTTTASSAVSRSTFAQRPDGRPALRDSVRLEMLAGAAARRTTAPIELVSPPARSSIGWWLGALGLTMLLAAQMIHVNRQVLAGTVLIGPTVRSVYAKFGSDVALPVDLDGYQLRQWGVSAVPNSSNALRVRASIMNVSSQLQPYPLLRVSLANRFGTKIGSRNFEPSEYAGKPVVRLLAPGERVDATVDILDPSNEAEGFEINICLRATDKNVSCVGDKSSSSKP